MTVKKEDYILEALGQIEDKYIEEAVTYKKPKVSFLYRKEWGVLAASFAVVLLATFAYRYMPIRSSEVTDERHEVEYVTNVEGEEGIEEAESARASYSYGITYEVVGDGAPESKQESIQKEIVEQDKNVAANNLNVSKTQEEADSVNAQVTCAYPTVEDMASCAEWKSAQEILSQDIAVFVGTVTQKEVYRVTSGVQTLFTVLTVDVADSIKGDAKNGESYKIYLPVGEADGIISETSLSGDLLKLAVGSRAIFMPKETTSETGTGSSGTAEAWICYADFADYYFSEGMRYLILETNDRLSYENTVYEMEGGTSATLEEAAEYLREVLKESTKENE